MSEKLIVGLGNPGKSYELTRHNLGFMVVQRLCERFKVVLKKSSFTNGATAEIELKGEKINFLLPLTYVNKSGQAVKAFLDEKSILVENTFVVIDDFSLDFGQLRVKSKGSDGGHNGLTSIIERLASDQFPRLRMGIGPLPGGGKSLKNAESLNDPVADFVLGKFTKKEVEELDRFIDEAVECCLVWVNNGITNAMEQFNRRK